MNIRWKGAVMATEGELRNVSTLACRSDDQLEAIIEHYATKRASSQVSKSSDTDRKLQPFIYFWMGWFL
jgi:hypothetical protein